MMYFMQFLISKGKSADNFVEVKLISTSKLFHLSDTLTLSELQIAVDEEVELLSNDMNDYPDYVKVTGLEYWNQLEKQWM